MMLDEHDGWYCALKPGTIAYPYGITAHDSHSEILGQIGQWGSMFWSFQISHIACNWTAQDGTRQIVNSCPDWILSVQDMKYMTLEYFPASGKVAYRSDRIWNCFSPEILNLLNKLISSGDQRKMRIEATYLQWVYLFYPHDRPDLNTNSPLFKTRSFVD